MESENSYLGRVFYRRVPFHRNHIFYRKGSDSMNRFIIAALIPSLAIVQPIHATELLPALEQTNDPVQLLERILSPSGTFDIEEARHFMSLSFIH